jgi:hypothetical protein
VGDSEKASNKGLMILMMMVMSRKATKENTPSKRVKRNSFILDPALKLLTRKKRNKHTVFQESNQPSKESSISAKQELKKKNKVKA